MKPTCLVPVFVVALSSGCSPLYIGQRDTARKQCETLPTVGERSTCRQQYVMTYEQYEKARQALRHSTHGNRSQETGDQTGCVIPRLPGEAPCRD